MTSTGRQDTSDTVASAARITAYAMNGSGGAGPIGPDKAADHKAAKDGFDFIWLQQETGSGAAADWLRGSGLDSFVAEALTAEETRPRCTVHGEGAIVVLRGVNLNPGAEPEDMISVRLWVEERRVIGVGLRPLMAVRDLFDAIERQQAPVNPGELVAKLALRLADAAEPTVADLNERVDALEELLLDEGALVSRGELASIRQTAIVLRRHMFPQRDALTTLEIEDLGWLQHRDRSRIREAADRVTRLSEELDAIRDRAQIVHDQIMDRRAEAMNSNMLVLSVVAAVFLPLGLLTGLLGINVGGVPGAGNPWAFWIVCTLLVVLAAGQIFLFRWFRLMR